LSRRRTTRTLASMMTTTLTTATRRTTSVAAVGVVSSFAAKTKTKTTTCMTKTTLKTCAMTATTLARSNSRPCGATNEKRASSSFGCSTTASKKGFAAGVFAGARSHGTTTSRRRPSATFLRASLSNDDFEGEDQIMRRDDEEYDDDEEEEGYTELQLAKQAKAATIKSAKFISSVVRHQDCPKTKIPEVAFIGRSNVGKSSLVNMLTNRKNVAKVSKTPGKTQTINHYEITTGDGKWFLVDLPGYGFANAPERLKREWAKFTREYLLERKNLISVMLLVDSTVKPQKLDLEALEFLADNDIPATIVFTKADKKRKAKGGKRATPAEHVEMFADEISEMFEELPPFVFTSANSGEGKKELLNHIATIREFMKTGGDDHVVEEEEEEDRTFVEE